MVKQKKSRKHIHISSIAEAYSGDAFAPTLEEIRRAFGPAKTLGAPDSVIAACDAQLEASGAYTLLQHSFELGQMPQTNFLGYSTLQQISQNGMVRACIETVADDIMRNFIELKREGQADKEPDSKEDSEKEFARLLAEALNEEEGKAKDDNANDETLNQLDEELRKLKVRQVLHEAVCLVGYMGGALVYIDTGEVDPEVLKMPLNISKASAELKKERRLRFVAIDPINIFPGTYNSISPLRPDYYKPRSWWVMGQEIHASRLIRLVANEVPTLLKPSYNFLGIAQAQILWDYILHFETNRDAVNRMLNKFSLTVMKTDMAEVLTQAGGLDELNKRINLLVRFRSNDGVQLIDKEAEDILKLETPIGGMTDVVRQSLEILAGINRTPAVKLLGISPSGFNATGQSDIRNYYDHIASQQNKILRAAIEKILNILQIRLFGKIDRTITFDFVPLGEEDKAAQASTQKTRADTMAVLLDRQIVSPEECRKVLADDPDSGFADIDVDDMPEPKEQGEAPGVETMAGFAGEGANRPEMPVPMPKLDDVDKAGAIGDALAKDGLARDDGTWITVHPNGDEGKGQPVLVDKEDGYRVLGGMGGRFTGKRMSDVKGKAGEAKGASSKSDTEGFAKEISQKVKNFEDIWAKKASSEEGSFMYNKGQLIYRYDATKEALELATEYAQYLTEDDMKKISDLAEKAIARGEEILSAMPPGLSDEKKYDYFVKEDGKELKKETWKIENDILSKIPFVKEEMDKKWGHLEEKVFDSGKIPNTVPFEDKDWGAVPGTYTVYRSGDTTRKEGIFTAGRFEDADAYATLGFTADGKQQDRGLVDRYSVTLQKPFVSKNLHDAHEKLFGKPVKHGKYGFGGEDWVKADNKIMKELKKRGYDAWLMTEPAPPAKKELAIIGDVARKQMEHTASTISESAFRKERKRIYENGNEATRKGTETAADSARAKNVDEQIVLSQLVYEGILTEEEAIAKGWEKPNTELIPPKVTKREKAGVVEDVKPEDIIAQDEPHWITIHPNGRREKGQPILVDGEKGDYTVLGGMGGQFNGQKMQDVVKGGEKTAESQGKKPLSEMTFADLPDNIKAAVKKLAENTGYDEDEYWGFFKDNTEEMLQGKIDALKNSASANELDKSVYDISAYILKEKFGKESEELEVKSEAEEPKEEAAEAKKPFDELTLKDLPEEVKGSVEKLAEITGWDPDKFFYNFKEMFKENSEGLLKSAITEYEKDPTEVNKYKADISAFILKEKYGTGVEETAIEQPQSTETITEPKVPSQMSYAELPANIQASLIKLTQGTEDTPEGMWDDMKGFPAEEIQNGLKLAENTLAHEGVSEFAKAEAQAEKEVWSFLASKKEQAEQKPLSAIKYEDLPQDIKNEVESWAKIFAKQGKTPEGVWESLKNQGEESIEKEKKLLEGQKEILSELGLSHLKVLEFMSQYQNGAKKEVSEKPLAEMKMAELPKNVQDAVNLLASKSKNDADAYWSNIKKVDDLDTIKYQVEFYGELSSPVAKAKVAMFQYLLDKKQEEQAQTKPSSQLKEPANPFAPSASSAKSGAKLSAYQKQKHADFFSKVNPTVPGSTVEVKEDGQIYIDGFSYGITTDSLYKHTAFASAKQLESMIDAVKQTVQQDGLTKLGQFKMSYLENLYQERKNQAWAKAPTKLSPSLAKLKAQPSVESIVGDIAKSMPGVSVKGAAVYVDGHFLDRHDLVMNNAYKTPEELEDSIRGIEKRLAKGEKDKELEFHLAFKKAVLAAKQGNPQVTSAELKKEHPVYDTTEATEDAMNGEAVHKMLGRPKKDKAKVKDYTYQYDRYMNGLLRNKNGYLAPADAVDRIHTFDKLMAESRLQEPVVLYRGLQFDKLQQAGLEPQKMFSVGGEYPDDGFESTSTKIGVARDFAGYDSSNGVVLKLLVPAGVGAVSALKDTHYPHEHEVILDRGLKWRTVGETTEKGIPVKIMELVGSTGDNND